LRRAISARYQKEVAAARTTQDDVARAAGVHRTTVSLALKRHPRIPGKTQERVRRIADELGYRPDPMLSSLVAYRTQKRPAAFHGTLAWFVSSAEGFNWREVPHFRDSYDGALARARRCGFELELFDLHAPGMTPHRLAGILRARNIQGLLLCPQRVPHLTLDFPWEEFSAVTFGYGVAEPRLHTVSPAHYLAVRRIMYELRQLGYRRIGLALDGAQNERTDGHNLAAYLIAKHEQQLPAVPPLPEPYSNVAALGDWIQRHQPDAIVSGAYYVLDMLRELKISVPDQLGVACPCIPSADTELAGIFEDWKCLGEIAVDALVAMLNRSECGVPARPQRLHVEGPWLPGRTLRAQVA
jgi:LacI family transcriptional regulator/LacI family repressor for deo operon, udp, cdd, tsx, nupC, and nupG